MSQSDLIRAVQKHYAEELPLGERWSDLTYIYSLRHPIGNYHRERIRRALLTLLNRQKIVLDHLTFLDIGCGTGDWLRVLAELRGTVQGMYGIDLAASSLRRSVQINAQIAVNLGDARRLPYPTEAFTWVSQFLAFEHLLANEDLQTACKEMARVCAPGGWMLWYDLLPLQSTYQRGFTQSEVQQLFPEFQLLDQCTVFRHFKIGRRQISTAYNLAQRSPLLADWVERFIPGPANNLMLLFRKNV